MPESDEKKAGSGTDSSSGVQSKSEESVPHEVCRKWGSLVYKVYERMVRESEVSFFVSTPQMISNIGFLLGACGIKETESVVDCYDAGCGKTDIDSLIDYTQKFAHSWSAEFRNLCGGKHYEARRVYAHPKFVHPHDEDVFKLFKHFRVQEKVFEGNAEVKLWLAHALKIEVSSSQKPLIMWKWGLSPIDQIKQRKMGLAAFEELGSKVRQTETKKTGGKYDFASWRPAQDSDEGEKKAPILVWTNHAIVEMPSEMFDAERIWTWNKLEYYRIQETPVRKISVVAGEYDFHTLILPTANRSLLLFLFYNHDGQMCSLDTLKDLVTAFQNRAPVILRKRNSADVKEKRTIYVPKWEHKDLPASRVADHMMASLNVLSFFRAGGFGGLAHPDAVPSSSGDPKKVSHIQHYGLFSFLNAQQEPNSQPPSSSLIAPGAPKSKKTDKFRKMPIEEPDASSVEFVPFPFCLIVWDCHRDLPAYMGKLTGEPTEQELEERKREKSAKQKNQICSIC
ncbi:unnamed protein product [Caenorhabditis sp. 36 PRJEB53466]|nr:unnamed protein product [Caenorhabditis sp. 36 PRJEB53466]